jgi:hypothetical protein
MVRSAALATRTSQATEAPALDATCETPKRVAWPSGLADFRQSVHPARYMDGVAAERARERP